MVKGLFFDLFFTLINPVYTDKNEYAVLNIPPSEWERYAEDESLYKERALGRVKTEQAIIDRIADNMPFPLTEVQKKEVIVRRETRMCNALLTIEEEILDTLNQLHNENIPICLISNADMIDCKYWKDSPLYQFFDFSIFSCNVGMLKPDVEIYQFALEKLNVRPEESMFVGDGGSDELYGAKCAGMKTVFTEYIEKKPMDKKKKILRHADYHIERFSQLLECVKEEKNGRRL